MYRTILLPLILAHKNFYKGSENFLKIKLREIISFGIKKLYLSLIKNKVNNIVNYMM